MSPTQSHSRAADPRPARTRVMILDAIERLGETEQEITVASIVAEAQLSRSSFYSQFSELGDVAVQLIRDARSRVRRQIEFDPSCSASQAAVHTLVALFGARRPLFAAIFGADCSVQTICQTCETLADWVVVDIARTAPPGVDIRNAASYIAGGVFGVLVNWVLADEPCSTDVLQSEIMSLLPDWLAAPYRVSALM